MSANQRQTYYKNGCTIRYSKTYEKWTVIYQGRKLEEFDLLSKAKKYCEDNFKKSKKGK